MTERITIRLPADLLSRAKRKAVAEGRTLTSLIEDGLRLVAVEERAALRKKRLQPRVSKARGGLMPGIELIRLSVVHEMEELDATRQMPRPK
jgi:hypothetical protein